MSGAGMAITTPTSGQQVPVYVPRQGREHILGIREGSGIVGFPKDAESVVAYYEGNLFGAENMVEWTSKVRQAYGRMVQKYPTVARGVFAKSDLVQIGYTDGNMVCVTGEMELKTWLAAGGVPESMPKDLVERLPERPQRRLLRP